MLSPLIKANLQLPSGLKYCSSYRYRCKMLLLPRETGHKTSWVTNDSRARRCGDKDGAKSQISWQPLKNKAKQNKTKPRGPPNLLPADSRRTAGMRLQSDCETFGNHPGGSLPIPSPHPLPASPCVDAPRRPATPKGLAETVAATRTQIKVPFIVESRGQRDGQG